MSDLLTMAIDAHGGAARWRRAAGIKVHFNFFGGVLDLKGFPGHWRLTASVNTRQPRATFEGFGPPGELWVFTTNRVWIEAPGGAVTAERNDPRAAFAGHVRETPWDALHLTYFLGYALWNYLSAPFLFLEAGFSVQELAPHPEGLETWRILEVTYPPNIPAHTAVQKLYFDDEGMLKRLDYTADVLGGVAAHYCYDPKAFGGLLMPTLRRVVRRTPEGPLLSGRTSFMLDYVDVEVIDA
jgi:hypothetical protein